MDLNKTLNKINTDREKVEAAWVFSLWKDPDLFANYPMVNEGKDTTLQNEDAKFYFSLGKSMYSQGYRTFDNITVSTFMDTKPSIKKKFDEYGGYKTVSDLMNLVSPDNCDAYFDKLARINSLSMISTKFDEMLEHVERFDNASADDVYNAFELLNNSVSLTAGHNERVENLVVDDAFIDRLKNGENIGYNYGKYSPLLNYITLGCAPGSLYMIGGHSGVGKSSFAFENIILGLHYSGVKTAVISNEMGSDPYKILLIEHVLIHDLDYWGLTRKQIKMGKFNEEQEAKVREACRIISEKYSDIMFVKMFDNDIHKIMKYLRRLKAKGVQVILYDTFKSDDSVDTGSIWQSLMLDARKLFQCCSKLDICLITTYQLALHTTNQRFLDAGCLSNSKQIKEIYETMVYCRPLWDDEYTGERYDVKAYTLDRENSKIKKEITLEKDKKYMLFFIDKTRADEDKQILIYQWNARFNRWNELGFARVINDHRGLN